MSRYIDTKWLEDNAKEYSLGYYDYDEYAVPLSAVEDAPTIEIVRCRECKHWRNDGFCTRPLYSIEYQYMRADDFCSYGSRSEKPNNCETCKWWEEDTSFCYSKADSDDHACHYERSSE